MTPKEWNRAAREAGAAAWQDAKSTGALRDTSPGSASPTWDDRVVAALSGMVAEHGFVRVRVIEHKDAQPTSGVHRDDGVRWGVAEADADGVVIREVHDCVGAAPQGTRVAVPYRLDDGRVEVAALWPVVWRSDDQPYWRYVHNGWSVERPGTFPPALDPACPSPELPYEVRIYSVPDGVLGEDHGGGGAPSWWTRAWCDRLDNAVLLADTAVAHRLSVPERPAGGDCGDLRAEVWQHATAEPWSRPVRVHRADAHPDRPTVPRLPPGHWPEGRPASVDPTPEPRWFTNAEHPPTCDLRVWTPGGDWMTLGWIVGGRAQAGITARLLCVGTGGPFTFADTWGPHEPDDSNYNWTEQGRELLDWHPEEPYVEGTAHYDEVRRREAADLVAALVERSGGTLTAEHVTARLAVGGREYRDFLRVGQVCVMDVLREKRLAAEVGSEERIRMRGALDALENHHRVDDWVIELTMTHLATNPRDAHYTERARRWRRRALQEYLAPRKDTAGVPGLAT
ncbi:hypothetical protein ACFYN0_22645 [Streptomyces sp. NPDC006704]|uniref:hypothetical protein n=1 Tax=Streptomyces sp. NPDC006704 TaxID=3364760 RepID=UPI0036991719